MNAISAEAEYRVLEGQALTALAEIALAQNRPELTLHHARGALLIHRETGHRPGHARATIVAEHARQRINGA